MTSVSDRRSRSALEPNQIWGSAVSGDLCTNHGQHSPPLSVWPHLFRGAGHEKRRGEQLKSSLAFSMYIGSFGRAECVFFVYLAEVCALCIHLCFFICLSVPILL